MPAEAEAPIMRIYGYEAEGKRLNIVTLFLPEQSSGLFFAPEPDLSLYPAYTETLLDRISHWVPETYIRHGFIERGGHLHQALLTGHERTIDFRSTIVFVTEGNDLSRIQSFMRFAHRGSKAQNKTLAMEHGVSWGQLREPARLDVVLPSGQQATAEGSVEAKNLLHAPDSEFNYLGLMLAVATRSGVLSHGARMVLQGGEMRVAPMAELAGETHAGVINYLKRTWQFELVPGLSDPSQKLGYVVSMPLVTAQGLEERLLAADHKQPSLPVFPERIHPLRWEPTALPDGSPCPRALSGDALPYFSEIH